MSRRISSRDDLFLSAVDMYTLLSLVFVGVAFMATYGAQERSILDLPAVPPDRVQQVSTREEKKEELWVRWANGGELKRDRGERCLVDIVRPGSFIQILPAQVSVPCWPRTFDGRDSSHDLLDKAVSQWSRAHPTEPEPEAVLICPADLEACARLQWVMAEHGFRPLAAVGGKK